MSGPKVYEFPDAALGNTAYLIDTGGGSAISVDPRRDAQEHLALAERLGLRIVGVLETHLHADFISGAREVADGTDADIFAAAAAKVQTPHVPVEPETTVTIGSAEVDVISTPGHTPEHVAYLVRTEHGEALFSGGAMIVGGVARTDLSGEDQTEQLARAQFASVRRLFALPGATPLYPTHGAGSFCSSGATRGPAGTLDDRRADDLLAIDDEDAFVTRLLASFGSYPRYFAHLAARNRDGMPLLRELDPVTELSPERARAAIDAGAHLIDGRDITAWAASHPAGAISNRVRSDFASWLGWIVPFGEPMVFVLEPDQVEEAARLAHRIGYDEIAGWTTHDAWVAAGLPVASSRIVAPAEAAGRAAGGGILLDVRQRSEVEASRIPGSIHIELGDLLAGASVESPDVVTYCGHGERSATAASVLLARGQRAVSMGGGIEAWKQTGHPVET